MRFDIQLFGGRGASSGGIIAKAEKLGEKAFLKGTKRQPTLDNDMMKLLKGDKIGESSNKLDAWLRGWDNANIKAEVKPTTGKYTIEYHRSRGVEIKNSVPKGYIKLEGATTAPNGYEWYSNGKSRFGGEYKSILVKKKRG